MPELPPQEPVPETWLNQATQPQGGESQPEPEPEDLAGEPVPDPWETGDTDG